jgi:hypothetical protein
MHKSMLEAKPGQRLTVLLSAEAFYDVCTYVPLCVSALPSIDAWGCLFADAVRLECVGLIR